MTKTLTEQWREGTLRGCFYWKLPNGNICTAYTDTMRDIKNVRDSDEVEVLEETPSYYEYQDILQQNVNQESAIETYIEQIKELEEQLADLSKKVERLQEQLNEANEVIKSYYEDTDSFECERLAEDYLEKWGIK